MGLWDGVARGHTSPGFNPAFAKVARKATMRRRRTFFMVVVLMGFRDAMR
jgi:hypothetical protein